MLTQPIIAFGRRKVNRWFPDPQGDAAASSSAAKFYLKNMLPSIVLNLALQLTSAAVYCGIHGLDYEDHPPFNDCYLLALYHCLVTASTVGYGDIPIRDDGEVRTWASIHVLLSVSLLGESIATFDVIRAERAKEVLRLDALHRKLDHALLESLNMRAAGLRPDLHRDAEGLTELEFVIGMCLELKMLDRDQITPFIDQFRKLDVDGNGRLAYQDLRQQAVLNTQQAGGIATKANLFVEVTELARRKAVNEQTSRQKRLTIEAGAGRRKSCCATPPAPLLKKRASGGGSSMSPSENGSHASVRGRGGSLKQSKWQHSAHEALEHKSEIASQSSTLQPETPPSTDRGDSPVIIRGSTADSPARIRISRPENARKAVTGQVAFGYVPDNPGGADDAHAHKAAFKQLKAVKNVLSIVNHVHLPLHLGGHAARHSSATGADGEAKKVSFSFAKTTTVAQGVKRFSKTRLPANAARTPTLGAKAFSKVYPGASPPAAAGDIEASGAGEPGRSRVQMQPTPGASASGGGASPPGPNGELTAVIPLT